VDALTRRADLLDVDVPRTVWARGRRPWRGTMIRIGLAAGLLLVALLVGAIAVRAVLVVVGIIVVVFATPIADRRLEKLGEEIRRADRGRAARLLAQIERRPLVDLFATHAWTALQRGRLNLVLGNGRAAAKALAEAAHHAGDPGNVALLSAQAHAHTLAGDRKDARVVLTQLEEKKQLSARDQLDYGIVLLEESGRTGAARVHLEAAREGLGGHPRVLAALALAYARGDESGRALEMLRAAEANEDLAGDEIATELLRRARKAARPLLDAEEKRARRAKQAGDEPRTTSGAGTPAARGRGEAKKDKKDRRKERREKRKAERDAEKEKTTREQAEQEQAAREKAEREQAAREKVEREKAARDLADREKAAREQAVRERETAIAAAKPVQPVAPAKPVEPAKPVAPPKPAAPVFAPPPVPSVPKAPSVAAPAIAPPVVPAGDAAPGVAADGWDDLLGDVPVPPPKPDKP